MGDYLKEEYIKDRIKKDLPVGTQRFVNNYRYCAVYNTTGTPHRGFDDINIFMKHANAGAYDIDYYVDGKLCPRERIESLNN